MSATLWQTPPCGFDTERLLTYAADRVAPPPGSHEAGCPYCQTAIAEFTQLWTPVRQWASRDVLLPDGFVATVMNRVRRLVQSPRHVAQITASGTTTLTSWVLALIASNATQATEGTSGWGGPSAGDAPGASRYGADGVTIDEIGASAISVTLAVTAGPVPSLVDLADAIRHNIITAIHDQTTLHADEVNIVIDDVMIEPR